MTEKTEIRDRANATDFAEAAEQESPGFFIELWDFLTHNKKWWLLPIVAVLLLVGALMMLSSTAIAPFIYTLF